MRTNIDLDYLRSRLDYCPETGSLTWLPAPRELFQCDRIFKSWNSRYSGKQAGTPFQGYLSVSINKRLFLAHRLAWFHFHGVWPEQDIDHINGDRSDNRMANLRSVSRSENLRNAAISSANTSGVRGVDWFKPIGKWRARIRADGKEVTVGYFDAKEDAVAARKEAERRYGYHPNHGRPLKSYN